MSLMPAPSVKIAGQDVPRRRFTRYAVLYFLGLVVVPVLGAALAFDVLFYLIAKHWFASCYGVLCLLG